MIIENQNLPEWNEEQIFQMQYIEYIKVVKEKSFKTIQTIYDIQFKNFVESIESLEMLGMIISDEFDAEIQQMLDFMKEDKNMVINQLIFKKLSEISEIKTDFLNLAQYYIDDEDLEDDESQVILEFMGREILPDASRLTEEEKGIVDITVLPIKEQIRIWAKLFGISEKAVKFENQSQLDCIKVWCAKQYLLRLVEFKKQKLSAKDDFDLENITNSQKIEWQGTQKELAELFIELNKKGFLDEIPTKLIQKYFTKSDSIQQTLKPSQDKRTKENTFDGVYSSKYKPMFDLIRKKT